MPSYLLGIDKGLTVSKAAIFDLQGREVAVQGHKVALSYPRPAWVERDSEVVWQTTAAAIREAIQKAGIDTRDIVGVGNSAHGNGVYLVDRTGAPLGPAVTSMDNRASAIIDYWFQPGGVREQAFPLVLTNMWAAQTAVLLAWFKRHRPEVWDRIGHAFTCKDYLKFRPDWFDHVDSGNCCRVVPGRRGGDCRGIRADSNNGGGQQLRRSNRVQAHCGRLPPYPVGQA